MFDAVEASDTTHQQFEDELLALLKLHCPEKTCCLAGSSVHCDKEVLRMRAKRIYDYVSHQNMDVSCFIGAAYRWFPNLARTIPPKSGYTHRAMGDIECSLMLMKWCKANLLIPEDIPKQAPQSILENPKEVKK